MDKRGVDTQTDQWADKQTDRGNDNTYRLNLTSGKKKSKCAWYIYALECLTTHDAVDATLAPATAH